MSKIEDFQKARRVADTVRSKIRKAMGRKPDGARDPNNDKHKCRVGFVKLEQGDWADIRLRLGMSYGYYGSSSGYRATDETVGKYMARAINKHMGAIAETAIEMAEADAEKARTAAEDEAKAVLVTTAGDDS